MLTVRNKPAAPKSAIVETAARLKAAAKVGAKPGKESKSIVKAERVKAGEFSLAALARELGLDPKAVRVRARRDATKLRAWLATDEDHKWVFKDKHLADVKAWLKPAKVDAPV